ncbi:DUF6230 family protein [Streptomyces sp. URMC 127]|uniref:DUF6230 family protein n=1 Tax=Streptomyces sp. URMC 127 TaxID=3423402 RepID=UPI003F19FC54
MRPTRRHRRPARRTSRAGIRRGRTNWPRFALASFAATLLAAGTATVTTAAGIPMSFAVAGSPFTVTAHRLEATGATQFASFRKDAQGVGRAAAVVGVRSARISGLCQSAVARTPLGPVTLVIRSGSDEPVRAENMVLDLSHLSGDMTFGSVEMGRDAATLRASGATGLAGTYGQQARTLTVDNLRLKAWSLTAGTFSLAGADMSVQRGERPCA